MISDLKKLSKDLIIYSVLIADFEKLDFKNDALAGVRANFFNSNNSPQSDKSDLPGENGGFSLSYSMNYGEPLHWKVTRNNSPYQKVKRVSDDVYCVLTYGDNGIVTNRLYYDNFHSFLAAEYYNKERENDLLGTVKPVTLEGYACLKYEKINTDGKKSTVYLYPSTRAPKKKCTALMYSNFGMIWYDESFKPEGIKDYTVAQGADSGFGFTVEDFLKPAVKPLDLQNAEYLTPEDYTVTEPEEAAAEPVSSGGYSAYDKIESILFEAHKTNKNIFGEVVSQGNDEPESESSEPETSPEEPEKDEEEAEKPEQAQDAAEKPEQAEKVSEKPEASPEYEKKDQPVPDETIETQNGVYSYYGKLDENNQRTGAGRTVSPDGLTVYDGNYAGDKRDGYGISYYRDGSPNYAGYWEQGNRSGCGVGYRHSDGTMHVGEWRENTPDGVGARFSKDGFFLDVCRYTMGTRDGKSISFDENGNVVISFYINGELIAQKTITDEELFPKKSDSTEVE